MTVEEVKKYYTNGYMFHKKTGMSQNTFGSWLKKGYVPLMSQAKLEKLTSGALKATWDLPEK